MTMSFIDRSQFSSMAPLSVNVCWSKTSSKRTDMEKGLKGITLTEPCSGS